jgi:hypothetical protein
MGHDTRDRILHGALWYQPAAAPSSTELRHSIVRKEQPVYDENDFEGTSYTKKPVGARMPRYHNGLRFSSLGPRGQHYGPNLERIVDTCATDKQHKFADLVDTDVVDEIVIEKQCFCANSDVENQTDIVRTCKALLSHFQDVFGREKTALRLQSEREAQLREWLPVPRYMKKSKPKHNNDTFHVIQRHIGEFLEVYWKWRNSRDAQHVRDIRQFLETKEYTLWRLAIRPHFKEKKYKAGADDVFPGMTAKWVYGRPGVGYIISQYVDALQDAIKDPKSYSNGPSHAPVSPLYSILCTVECLHLLAVSEKMLSDKSDEERLQLYVDELSVSSTDDPARRWLLKHALAQLTAYSYGDALPIVGLSLKSELDRVKSRLRRMMALPVLGPEHAYLSNDTDRYTYTDPGCWSFMHEQHCAKTVPHFLFNPHWQIMVYNVMLPRFLDEQDDRHGQVNSEDTPVMMAKFDRYTTLMKPYQIEGDVLNDTRQNSLLYDPHKWPRRSPLVFNIAAHPSDSWYILDFICKELLQKRHISVYEMTRKKDGCMLLHVAASSGNYRTVDYLLNYYNKTITDRSRFHDIINQTNTRTRKNEPCRQEKGETPRDVVENRLYSLVQQPKIEARGLSSDEITQLEKRLSRVDKVMVDWHVQNNPNAKDSMPRHKIEDTLKVLLTKHGVDIDDRVTKARRLLELMAVDDWTLVGKR